MDSLNPNAASPGLLVRGRAGLQLLVVSTWGEGVQNGVVGAVGVDTMDR